MVKKSSPDSVKVAVDKKTSDKYFEGVGRRKTSVARVRIYPHSKEPKVFLVNNKESAKYFPEIEYQRIINSPLKLINDSANKKISVLISGGGKTAQAEAIKLGLSRALILFNKDYRGKLKKSGFLTRDAREKERKKFGLKKARRAPQWSKR